MYRLITATFALALLAWTGQLYVTSASNQQRYMRDGTAGAALTLTAQDAHTACQAALTDFAGSTDATADLSCANTGEIICATYEWAAVTITSVRALGTKIEMQCDTSNDSGSTWGPVMTEDSAHAQDIRTWGATSSVSGRPLRAVFSLSDELLRCRAWADSATDATDTVAFSVVLSR